MHYFITKVYKIQDLFTPSPIIPLEPKDIVLSIPITRSTLIKLEAQALQQCTTLSTLVNNILEQATTQANP